MGRLRVMVLLMSAWVPAASGASEAQPGFSITRGIVHHQVFQRDENNSADLQVAGRAPSDLEATVYVSVNDRGAPLQGFQDLPAGRKGSESSGPASWISWSETSGSWRGSPTCRVREFWPGWRNPRSGFTAWIWRIDGASLGNRSTRCGRPWIRSTGPSPPGAPVWVRPLRARSAESGPM